MNSTARDLEALREQHRWAVEIVQRHFARGIEQICDPDFLGQRYSEFLHRDDPIYAELLKSMDDEPLAKTFVSYWTIAQTLATQSRFWLESAIAEVIIHQAKKRGRLATEIYSHAMLGRGYPAHRRPVAELGESEVEYQGERSPWQVRIQRGALQAIDLLVGEQEREERPRRDPRPPREWDQAANRRACERDAAHLKRVAESFKGPPADLTTIQCNLLVIEPDKLKGEIHAWAIRFVNPKTLAQHAARKQERVNLLRLYALLVQEKIMRQPESISVCVAELVPRGSGWASQDHYPDYFSPLTYWSCRKLWDFIGVPFAVVQIAIRDVAKIFQDRLKDGLRKLLPSDDPPPGSLF